MNYKVLAQKWTTKQRAQGFETDRLPNLAKLRESQKDEDGRDPIDSVSLTKNDKKTSNAK